MTLRTATTFRRELFSLAPGVGRDSRPLSTTDAARGPLSAAQIEQHLGDNTSVA